MRSCCRVQGGSNRIATTSTSYICLVRYRDLGHAAAPCPRRSAQRAQHTVVAGSEYDNPALYSNEDAFSLSSYWDARYQREGGAAFEWYRGYDSLEPVLSRHLDKSAPLLHVGVGTSRIQYYMHLDGYKEIVNVDYAPTCIEQLKELYPAVPGLLYEVADCRTMPQYGDGSFGGVLDKGTVDALLCGDSDEADSYAMLKEVIRVLRPGGPYICITYAPPKSRLRYLVRPGLVWSRVCFYEVGQQGYREGPVEVPLDGGALSETGEEAWSEYPKQGYSHFVYVCER